MRPRPTHGHNPASRAQAAALAPLTSQALAQAAPAVHGNVWQPVQGPHLRTVRTSFTRNRTGCVGISLSTGSDGRQWLYVNLGSTNRKIRITPANRDQAWRRAVQMRARHELAIRAANTAILTARGTIRGTIRTITTTTHQHAKHQ